MASKGLFSPLKNGFPLRYLFRSLLALWSVREVTSSAQLKGDWFGDKVCLKACCQPYDLYSTLRSSLEDPIYGSVGQDAAREEVLMKFKKHITSPTKPLYLFFIGATGTGKSHMTKVIQNSIYSACPSGLISFGAQDYMPTASSSFPETFYSRIGKAAVDAGEERMVTVVFDEFQQLRNYNSTYEFVMHTIKGIYDGKLSLQNKESLNVQNWVFIFATDFNYLTKEAPVYNLFVNRWLNIGTEYCVDHRDSPECSLTEYHKERLAMIKTLSEAHADAYGEFQFGKVVPASHIIPFRPLQTPESIRLLRALYKQANMKLYGRMLHLQAGFLDKVEHRHVLTGWVASARGCEDIQDSSYQCDSRPVGVAKGGAWEVRKAWDELNNAVFDIATDWVDAEKSPLADGAHRLADSMGRRYDTTKLLVWLQDHVDAVCVCKVPGPGAKNAFVTPLEYKQKYTRHWFEATKQLCLKAHERQPRSEGHTETTESSLVMDCKSLS